MQTESEKRDLINNVLVNLYDASVDRVIRNLATVVRLGGPDQLLNPRIKDLKGLYNALGPERRRLFYEAVAAIAEFSVFCTLDFIENFDGFESETNREEFPRLSLTYCHMVENELAQEVLSTFGSNALGMAFKRVARDDKSRQLIDETIQNIIDRSSQK